MSAAAHHLHAPSAELGSTSRWAQELEKIAADWPTTSVAAQACIRAVLHAVAREDANARKADDFMLELLKRLDEPVAPHRWKPSSMSAAAVMLPRQ